MDPIIVAALITLCAAVLTIVSAWLLEYRKGKREDEVRETYWKREANRPREEALVVFKGGDPARAEQLLATEFQLPMASISGSAFSNEVKVQTPDGELIEAYNVVKVGLRGELTARLIKGGHDEEPPITITMPNDDESSS